jgi:hypothetical protein
MAKNRNTFAKQQREADKKRKAKGKRDRRDERKEGANDDRSIMQHEPPESDHVPLPESSDQ